jgi:hypothetical protein
MCEGCIPEDMNEFWANIDKNGDGGCWIWKGEKQYDGYGKLSCRRVQGCKWSLPDSYMPWRTHRLSYVIHYGKITKGLFICHKCDNPPCCNPDHLFMGTQRENYYDMIRKGRSPNGMPASALDGYIRNVERNARKSGIKMERFYRNYPLVEIVRRERQPEYPSATVEVLRCGHLKIIEDSPYDDIIPTRRRCSHCYVERISIKDRS